MQEYSDGAGPAGKIPHAATAKMWKSGNSIIKRCQNASFPYERYKFLVFTRNIERRSPP